jgi:hypothetical protein
MLDLRRLNKNRFVLAKRYWMLSITLKILIFVIGGLSVFNVISSHYVPLIILLLGVFSEGFQWYSDVIKGRSEMLLRSLDLCSSFSKEISDADKRDIVSFIPKKVRKKLDVKEVVDNYFASEQNPGPAKAVENLYESAWYTRRQAGTMAAICLCIFVLVLLFSVIILIISSQELNDLNTREGVNKIVTSWLLLLFSLGLSKYGWSYFKLFQRCQKTVSSSTHLLSNNEISESDAIKQWYEYQIVRSASPLLPQWLWWAMESSLNDAWNRVNKHD